MYKSDTTSQLFTALSQAQGEFKAAIMDTTNPHFKSRFASLNAVQEVYRLPFLKHGLSVVQMVESVDERYEIVTTLGHKSGEWISSQFKLLIDRQNMQGLGMAITYARRYAISAMVGIVSDEDDDGNSASKPSPSFPSKPIMDMAKAMGYNGNMSVTNLVKAQGIVEAEPKAFKEAREQREQAEVEAQKIVDGGLPFEPFVPDSMDEMYPPMSDGELLGSASYVVDFGKDSGKTLEQMGKTEVRKKLEWIEKDAKPPIGKKMQTFMDHAKLYLGDK